MVWSQEYLLFLQKTLVWWLVSTWAVHNCLQLQGIQQPFLPFTHSEAQTPYKHTHVPNQKKLNLHFLTSGGEKFSHQAQAPLFSVCMYIYIHMHMHTYLYLLSWVWVWMYACRCPSGTRGQPPVQCSPSTLFEQGLISDVHYELAGFQASVLLSLPSISLCSARITDLRFQFNSLWVLGN